MAKSTRIPVFLAALETMLRPIVRYCLRRGLHVQDLVEAVKRVLVQVANEELSDQGNVSRLAAATGLQRRDVTRLLAEDQTSHEPMGLVNRVIGQWRHNRRFLDASGNPKRLSLDPSERGSFTALVETVTRDIPAGAIVFELERLNAVKKSAGSIELLAPAYVPKEDFREGYRMLARDVSNLMEAVTSNVEESSPVPNLHATIEFDNIRREELPKLRTWLLEEGSRFQRRVSKHLSQFDLDINPPKSPAGGGGKVSFSVFSLIHPLPADEEAHVRRKKTSR